FRPASASFKMPMICSSVNRFFIAVPLWNGLYTVTVLNAGSRSLLNATEVIAKYLVKLEERMRETADSYAQFKKEQEARHG
ncbi:hypothetical protein KTD12_20130, partial [Burkholderia multivorans]|uniref:hypothetical protein n=1 Tax=Burkholderia multivorans TaxID=87883 RepID=UPI001C240912